MKKRGYMGTEDTASSDGKRGGMEKFDVWHTSMMMVMMMPMIEKRRAKKKMFEVKWFGSVSCSANANMLQ